MTKKTEQESQADLVATAEDQITENVIPLVTECIHSKDSQREGFVL